MSTGVPVGKKQADIVSPIVFVGPTASGKTTSLILLHSTCIDYKEDMNIKSYNPLIKSRDFNLYKQASNLMKYGIPPDATRAASKDLKVELELAFGGLIHRKTVRMIFADMAGAISSSLMRVFPELPGMTPDEVKKTLEGVGIGEDDAEYLIRNILRARGLILVADSSNIGAGKDDPDADLANYLNNLSNYVQAHGTAPKGIALILTKFDKWFVKYPSPTEDDLKRFVKNHLSNVNNYAETLNKKAGTRYSVFYSALKETKTKDDSLAFVVEAENSRGQRRVLYSVTEYERLISWIRDTFSV